MLPSGFASGPPGDPSGKHRSMSFVVGVNGPESKQGTRLDVSFDSRFGSQLLKHLRVSRTFTPDELIAFYTRTNGTLYVILCIL